jgi:pimeloyl-ACP methyl ester carboxylesterase
MHTISQGMQMSEKSFLSLSAVGFHRIAYTEWGPPDAARTVVCVHGLTRNGRDFDFLAWALAAEGWRVVCPDVVGRGRSDRLPVPDLYGFPQYLADMTALIARLDVAELDWVGTSMGGAIGLLLAAQPKTPIRRLVLNDVGPLIPKASLERIAGYVGADRDFDDIDGVERYLREIFAGFGLLTDAQWLHLAIHSAVTQPDGRWRLAYDPAIGTSMTTKPIEDVNLWPLWQRVTGPVLILRGESSDVLLPDTAKAMIEHSPHAKLVEFSGVGHASALMAEDQIATVRDFLTA